MAKEVYDLGPGRAKRKAERQSKRATKKTNRKAKSTARKTKKADKKAAIASMPGTSGLEKRLNYKGAKARAKKADKAAVKKAKSVTPAQRKANQTKATSDHNKRLAAAKSKHGNKKKAATTTTTKTKPKTTYDQAWNKNFKVHPTGGTREDKHGNIYDNTPKGKAQFKKDAMAYNKENKK